MTLNQLALELIRAHKENSGDADYVLTVEQWIRDAMQELAVVSDWRAFILNSTLATVAGTRTYTLPTKVRDVDLIFEPSSRTNIEYITKERLADLQLDLTQPGRPTFWYYEDQEVVSNDYRYEIGFQPVPNAIFTMTVKYDIIPSDILTSDHIPVQGNMLMPLRFCARSYMCLDDKDYEGADRFYQRFLGMLDQLIKRENNKGQDRPRLQMRDIPGRAGDRRLARLDPNHFS